MIKLEHSEVMGLEHAIRGMRNPMNSWSKSDSYKTHIEDSETMETSEYAYFIGENDLALMNKLASAGPVHGKFRRMITVYLDITAPLYWWKEFDTYKVGTVANSCSTMHKIHAKEFTLSDFSCEHMLGGFNEDGTETGLFLDVTTEQDGTELYSPAGMLLLTVKMLNICRNSFLKTNDKKYWWQMIKLLPSSYNQKRTVMLNYEVLANIYEYRKNHKLDEWREFCEWIEQLPYSELITGKEKQHDN